MNAAQVQLNVALNAPVQASSRARPEAATLDFRSIRDSAVKSLDNGKKDTAEEKPATAAGKDTELAAETGALLQTAVQPLQTATAGAADTTDNSAVQIQPEISTCCSMPDTIGKIADILEGFGLLKQDGSTQMISQEGLQLLAQLAQSGVDATDTLAIGANITAGTTAGNEAGMLKATSTDEMQTLQGLINEYFCSLENDKTGVADAAVTAGTQQTADQLSSLGEGAASSAVSLPRSPNDAVQDKPATQDEQAAQGVQQAQGGQQAPAQVMLGRLVGALHKALGETHEDGDSSAKNDAPLAQPDTAAPADAIRPTDFALRVHASAQTSSMAEPAKITGKDMTENIRNIVERMSYSSAKDEQEFSVSLKPAHLGELSIKLIKNGDGMLAQIKAADETTRGLIQNELNTLADQLKEKGVSLNKIEVTYEAPSFSFNPQQHSSQRQNSETSSGSRAKIVRTAGAVQAYEAAAPTADTPLYAGESSIEFQA